ncbi:uncharacterized protein LOC133973632 isoform X2 [Platichthys flesus]|uniref:uncharacterized protein LOC133973632 isoform X2 n=1 Tax=Platichthys flesus TaxID=8260 RepID=UPI002DB6F6B6|nr:uncharacterized protein LOC133973632 isoform X2 [Platichthys flesus]
MDAASGRKWFAEREPPPPRSQRHPPPLRTEQKVLAVQYSSIIITAGAEVTLSCDKMRDDHVNCGATDWLFVDSEGTAPVKLFVKGKLDISRISKYNADRLCLATNCSLVIREVTDEDAGRYDCRQFDLTNQTDKDHVVYLSVVNVTEQKRSDEVTLSCSVSTYRRYGITVKWLFMNMDGTENTTELKTSQSYRSANVSFSKSHFVLKMKNYSSLTCKVNDGYKEEKFSFIPPSSGKNEPAPGNKVMTTDWWWYIRLVVGFASIVILVVILIRWRRNKIQGGDVAVAFSTVEAPSSSSGPSADPSSLYANVTFIQ